jgi:glutamate synthase domain-containing protein 2
MEILTITLITIGTGFTGLFIYDRFIQKKNIVITRFPILGRFRYLAHEIRPFFRQYFGDDDSFAPRIIVDWILAVSKGKPGHFSFDKFDTTGHLHDGNHQLIHSSTPYNKEEMKPIYPTVGEKRKHPFKFNTYFYRSAMSLGAIGFEATQAMASACANCKAPFNTGEGGLSVHHIPNVKFNYQNFFKYHKISKLFKPLYKLTPTKRLKNNLIDIMGNISCEKNKRDLYLFDEKNFLFYAINWEAPLEAFPKPEELDDSFGHIIFQLGSGLYGLREKRDDGLVKLDHTRYKKIMSFCRATEIKLAQGAKQSGGILKDVKNTETISEIRGVHPHIDLISPNRFPFYQKNKESEFFDFIEKLSEESNGKPVGIKLVISNEQNIEPLAKEIKKRKGKSGPDWFTIDGGDGGSGTAPISMGIMYGKTIMPALKITNNVLKKHGVRKYVKILASAKLYSPHMSARALAFGADAIGNARSIMISAGCIRAGLCSGENGDCPVGLATMKKQNRKSYAQAMDEKIKQVSNYLKAHNQELILVSAIAGVDSPSKLNNSHISKLSEKL